MKLVLTVDLAVDSPGSGSLLADSEGKRLARLMLRTDLMPYDLDRPGGVMLGTLSRVIEDTCPAVSLSTEYL